MGIRPEQVTCSATFDIFAVSVAAIISSSTCLHGQLLSVVFDVFT